MEQRRHRKQTLKPRIQQQPPPDKKKSNLSHPKSKPSKEISGRTKEEQRKNLKRMVRKLPSMFPHISSKKNAAKSGCRSKRIKSNKQIKLPPFPSYLLQNSNIFGFFFHGLLLLLPQTKGKKSREEDI